MDGNKSYEVFPNRELFKLSENIGMQVSYEVHDSLLYELNRIGLITDQEHSRLGSGEYLEIISSEISASVLECFGVVLNGIHRDRKDDACLHAQIGGDANAPTAALQASDNVSVINVG